MERMKGVGVRSRIFTLVRKSAMGEGRGEGPNQGPIRVAYRIILESAVREENLAVAASSVGSRGRGGGGGSGGAHGAEGGIGGRT